MKTKMFFLILFLFCFFILVAPRFYSYAEEVRVVRGIIENITSDSIVVRNQFYNYTGVPLKDSSDRDLPRSELSVGKKVEIYFVNNRISTILIHEDMLEWNWYEKVDLFNNYHISFYYNFVFERFKPRSYGGLLPGPALCFTKCTSECNDCTRQFRKYV